MPLDVTAQPGFFTSLFGCIVLLAIRHQPVHARMVGMLSGTVLLLAPRMQLLENFVAGLPAVAAFGVILRAFLVTVAILHAPRLVKVCNIN